MAELRFGDSVRATWADVINDISSITVGTKLVSYSETEVVYSGGGRTYTLTGSGIQILSIDGEDVISGGHLDEINLSIWGEDRMTISDLDLDFLKVMTAVREDTDGTDQSAVEDIFLGLNWLFVGNETRDILNEAAVSDDGIELILRGDDVIYLDDGNDVFDSGLGDDQIYGGGGADSIYGGDDNDYLYGGFQADTIYGGGGDDRVHGSAGDDILRGGRGADRIYGGSGEDTFVFEEGDDSATIRDFEDGVDHIALFTSEEINIFQSGANTVIEFGDDSITLRYFDADLITAEDFL